MVKVIAEIGINHCGDMNIAHRLIDAAKEAGADVVKFQTFRTEALVDRDSKRMPYQSDERCGAITQFEMLKAVELNEEQHVELMAHCRDAGLGFLSTPYDDESLDLLVRLDCDCIKVASTDTTNLLLLRRIAATGRAVILSTGVTELWEVAKAVREFDKAGALGRLTLLHCLSYYPAPIEQANLSAIARMREAFAVPVGYSDHTVSLDMGAWAVLTGAAVIEKHFTHDKAAPGPDHAASLTPDELACYISAIRRAEAALGDGIKRIQPAEAEVKMHMQKSMVAVRDLPAGTVLTEEHLTAMRPANGISPLDLDRVLGNRLTLPMVARERLRWSHLGGE